MVTIFRNPNEMILATIYRMGRCVVTYHIILLPHGGYSKVPFLINHVDSIKVWGLCPQTPPLSTSGDLLLINSLLGESDALLSLDYDDINTRWARRSSRILRRGTSIDSVAYQTNISTHIRAIYARTLTWRIISQLEILQLRITS